MTHPSRRLLVVDETEEARTTLARHFSALGWEVAEAAGAVDALAHALVLHPDAIVMNASLSGFEGLETATILRRISPGVAVVLIADPDADTDEEPHASEHREWFRCFPKPLDLEALARAVETERADLRGGLR